MGLPASPVNQSVINGHRSIMTIYIWPLIVVALILMSWIAYKYQIDIIKYGGERLSGIRIEIKEVNVIKEEWQRKIIGAIASVKNGP
jgi:hypothetical protein